MTTHLPTGFSNVELLDALGLQQKHGFARRLLGSAGLVAAGVVVGAAAGLLFAPRSGRQLRQDLRISAKELGEQVGSTANSAMEAARRKGNEMKNHGDPMPHV